MSALALTVGFVGWVVLRFSRVALDGEPRQGAFMALDVPRRSPACWLLVVAGNLVQLARGLGRRSALTLQPACCCSTPNGPGPGGRARKKSR